MVASAVEVIAMPDTHYPPPPATRPSGAYLQHRKDEPPDAQWACAHGDDWVIATRRSDGNYECPQCRAMVVHAAPR